MRRRCVLALSAGLASSAFLAGCSSDTTTESTTVPEDSTSNQPTSTTAVTTDPGKPDGIYVQSFEERMAMQGSTTAGDYTVALMFTVPHTFWTMTGWDRSKTGDRDEDAIHLMAVVWDEDSDTVLPDAGVSVELADGEDLVSQEVIYPMLSQPMGFHYGGNFSLPEDGTYTANISIGGIAARTTGSFEGRFASAETAELSLDFTEESRSRVGSTPLDAAGEPGALSPMDTSYPKSVAPGPDGLPGSVRGTAALDDARFDVTTLDSAGRVDRPDDAYLAVSARTRYNDYELSGMAVDATLDRDGDTVFEGGLERTLSPDVGYHYGAAVPDVESGDELTLSVETPPQVGRHEGYETAFVDMRQDVTLSL